MKPKPNWLTKFLLLSIFCLIGASQIFAAENFRGDERKPRKEKAFRSSNLVKVFPDMFKRSMHVVARSTIKTEVNFFVFDMEGSMMVNFKLKKGEKKTIEGLPKGTYIYQAFCEDVQAASGKIQMR